MKKVLFYINKLAKGGAQRVIVNIANRFAKEGYEVCFVTTMEGNEYALEPSIEHVILGVEKTNVITQNIKRITKLKEVCKAYQPDIIISFTLEATVRAIIVAKMLHQKCIVSVRVAPQTIFVGLRGVITKLLYRHTDVIVCQNEDAKSFFSSQMQQKITIIPNMLNPDFIREPLGGERNQKIITVGRLDRQKNQAMLLEAFARSKQYEKGWTLEIYGEGSLKEDLLNKIKELHLENFVSLMGLSNQIPEILYEAGLFVLSSQFEGVPNALMEAMAEGVPCISTDCIGGGARDLIQDHENGLLVDKDNVEELAEAITYMCDNREAAFQMGIKAHEICELYSPDGIFKQWEALAIQVSEGNYQKS